jgi:hypothetical protein
MNCPICKKPVPPKDSDDPQSVYPFCSRRCQLVDLGRWLDGKYQIPAHGDDAAIIEEPHDEEQ